MKILAIDSNEERLRKMLVNTNGEIMKPSDKIFTAEIINKKTQLKENLKLQNSIKISNKKKIENKILTQKPIINKIFPLNNQSQCINQTKCSSTSLPPLNRVKASQVLSSSIPTPTSQLKTSFHPEHVSQLQSSLNPVQTCQLQPYSSQVQTSQLQTYSSQAPTSQLPTYSSQIPTSQSLYSLIKENNDYFPVQASTSFQQITDQEAVYEFPSTVQTIPTCQVINLRSFDESASSNNSENASKIREDYDESLPSPTRSNTTKSNTVPNEMTNIVSKLISKKITLETVEFMEALAIHLRHQYNKEQEANLVKAAFEIPQHYFENGVNKVEISPGCGFYIAENIISDIKKRAGNNWRDVVTALIDEVYGTEIKHFSAKGRFSKKRRGINKNLFNGLYYLAKEIDESVTLSKLIKVINDQACNARKLGDGEYNKSKKIGNSQRREIISEDEDEVIESEDDGDDKKDNEDGNDDNSDEDDGLNTQCSENFSEERFLQAL